MSPADFAPIAAGRSRRLGAKRRSACPGLALPIPWIAAAVCAAWLLAGMPAHAEPAFNHLVGRVMAQHPAARAELINLAVNQFEHADSNGPTVWQSPQQLALRGAGDCKDFAYAKFWLLRHSGTPRERVRLAYGQWQAGAERRLHLVVLLWTDAGSPLVLDNLMPGMHRLEARRDLQIRFSFDERAFFDQAGAQQIPDQPIKGWRGLWERTAGAELMQAALPRHDAAAHQRPGRSGAV